MYVGRQFFDQMEVFLGILWMLWVFFGLIFARWALFLGQQTIFTDIFRLVGQFLGDNMYFMVFHGPPILFVGCFLSCCV